MSGGHVKPALISAIAESLGITDLSDDGARVLAPDVEYRVRDILQVRNSGALTGRMASCNVQSRSKRASGHRCVLILPLYQQQCQTGAEHRVLASAPQSMINSI